MLGIRAAASVALRTTAEWVLRKTANLPHYDAASTGRRTTGWNVGTAAINAILFASADELRRRSHDQARRNPWAKRGLDVFTDNVVGTGIRPQSLHPDEDVRKAIHEAHARWSEEADAAGVTDYYGLQAQAVRGASEGGDIFARYRFRRADDGLSVPLQIQLLEAEHVPTWLNQPLASGGMIKAGIEFNPIGGRAAYHMYAEHPGEVALLANGSELRRVPAEFVAHHFEPLRPGQIRGLPRLSTALLRLYEFDLYEDAELVRKRDASMFSGFITETGGPAKPVMPGESGTDGDTGKALEITKLEPGTWQKLRPGEDVKPADPADMGEGYEAFVKWVLRGIAAAIGITYEQLTGDLSDVNFSSIRAGLIEFRRAVERYQHSIFVYQFCRPTWALWMDTAVLAGVFPISATNYRRDRANWLKVKWVPQGFAWVDPEKEIKAIVMAIRAGLMSRSEAVSQYGYDAEAIDAEIAADNKRADDLGLAFDSDGRRPANGGSAAAGVGHNGGPPLDDAGDQTDQRKSA